MQRPTPIEARERIVEVVGECVYHALGLKETLEIERSALEAEDAQALHDAVTIKSECIVKLRELDKQRRALCEASGFDTGPQQMEQMSAWCDEDSVVANCWSHFMTIAADCNALNMTNGAIIRVRQQQIETNLAVLRGADPVPDTYACGRAEAVGHAPRSLAQA